MIKKRNGYSLLGMFYLISFVSVMVVLFCIAILSFILMREKPPETVEKGTFLVLLSLLVVCGIISIMMFLFIGRFILKPIVRFSNSMKKVAKGDFNITLEEDSKIKEVVEMRDSFNIMTQELSSIETLRTDFITNVSHEFKTPLAAVEGFATLLQDDTLSKEERKDYTNMIIESAKQLSELTGNLLNLSRLEKQEVILKEECFSLDEQIRKCILMQESRWSDKNINMVIELQDVTYYGNKVLLSQVWKNILDNAIKFTKQNGDVFIHLEDTSQYISISIRDSGIGMNEEELSHIFTKFYQTDETRNQLGNGLGLALVKRIVELSGGTIHVVSELGKGSTFKVILPNK